MRLYLDTSVIRRCVDGTVAERQIGLGWIRRAADSPTGTILASSLVRAECLVLPYRNHDNELIDRFESVFRENGIVLVSISDEILELATRIFADYRIKMADAIHTATAISGKCDALVARDDGWITKGPVMGLPLLPFEDQAS